LSYARNATSAKVTGIAHGHNSFCGGRGLSPARPNPDHPGRETGESSALAPIQLDLDFQMQPPLVA